MHSSNLISITANGMYESWNKKQYAKKRIQKLFLELKSRRKMQEASWQQQMWITIGHWLFRARN